MAKIFHGWIAILMTAAALLSSCISEQGDEYIINVRVGDAVPAFSCTMNDGSVLNTASYDSESEYNIVFFNTSCTDCRKVLKVLDELVGNDAETGLVFYCISREQGAASVAAYWQEQHLRLPYSAQSDRRIYSLFATQGIPLIVGIRGGRIVSLKTLWATPD